MITDGYFYGEEVRLDGAIRIVSRYFQYCSSSSAKARSDAVPGTHKRRRFRRERGGAASIPLGQSRCLWVTGTRPGDDDQILGVFEVLGVLAVVSPSWLRSPLWPLPPADLRYQINFARRADG